MPTPEMNKRMTAVLCMPGNDVCVDCPAPRPLWASFLVSPIEIDRRLGVLCCPNCAQHHHFELGDKRTMIKFLKMAHEWTEEDIVNMEDCGNDFVNKCFEAKLTTDDYDKNTVLDDEEAEEEMRSKFIKKKYKKLKYFDEVIYHQEILKVLQRKHEQRKLEKEKQDRRKNRRKHHHHGSWKSNHSCEDDIRSVATESSDGSGDRRQHQSSSSASSTAAKKEDRQSKMPEKSHSARDLRRELANQDLDGGPRGSKSHHEKSSSKRSDSYHSRSKRSSSHRRLSSGENEDNCDDIKNTSSEDKQPRIPERLSSMNERFGNKNSSGDFGGDHDDDVESSERGSRKDGSSSHGNNNIMDPSGGSLGNKSAHSAHTLRSTGDSTIDSTTSHGDRAVQQQQQQQQQQQYPDDDDDDDNGNESIWKRPKFKPNPWAVEGSPFANNAGDDYQGRLSA